MGHKANNSFFDHKKPWSKRKDFILDYYLKPYLAKVAKLGRPILLVDGFAGPGRFRDGSLGSPLIICQKAIEAIARGTKVQVLCVEEKPDLYGPLTENLQPYAFAGTRNCAFLDVLPEIEHLAQSHTVFLYIDPCAIEGLEWKSLDRIFRHVADSRSSVEVLLNFNARAFGRRARAALAPDAQAEDQEDEDDDLSDTLTIALSPTERLTRVVGGDWWQEIVNKQSNFSAEVSEIMSGLCDQLRLRFNEVCYHAVKERAAHTIPKYYLVFGSRSEHAFILMNDAAAKSRQLLAEQEATPQGTLFEIRPTELVPSLERLHKLVLDGTPVPVSRGRLVLRVMKRAFGDYSTSEIRRCVSQLIQDGKLASSTDKSRINDTVEVWRKP